MQKVKYLYFEDATRSVVKYYARIYRRENVGHDLRTASLTRRI